MHTLIALPRVINNRHAASRSVRSGSWIYANHQVRLESLTKFISDVYWNAELEK
jgi:hypothetical protein